MWTLVLVGAAALVAIVAISARNVAHDIGYLRAWRRVGATTDESRRVLRKAVGVTVFDSAMLVLGALGMVVLAVFVMLRGVVKG